jgi:hypothetical protein
MSAYDQFLEKKPLMLSDYGRHEAAFQLRVLEDYMDKVELVLRDLKEFIIATLYDLAANDWIYDRAPDMIRYYKDMIDRWYKEFRERLDLVEKVFSSIVEDAKKRQQQG